MTPILKLTHTENKKVVKTEKQYLLFSITLF